MDSNNTVQGKAITGEKDRVFSRGKTSCSKTCGLKKYVKALPFLGELESSYGRSLRVSLWKTTQRKQHMIGKAQERS